MNAVRKKIGIVTGLRFERAIITRWEGALGAVAPLTACASAKPEKARRKAEEMVAQGAAGLVSFGIAGALDPGLQPGTLVLARKVLDENGGEFETSKAWCERLWAQMHSNVAWDEAALISVAMPATTAAAKKELLESSGARAVDMESAAVATVARQYDLPFITVRAIADGATQELPQAALASTSADGSINIRAAIAAFLKHPSQLPAALRLAHQTGCAKRTLARTAHAGLPSFGLF